MRSDGEHLVAAAVSDLEPAAACQLTRISSRPPPNSRSTVLSHTVSLAGPPEHGSAITRLKASSTRSARRSSRKCLAVSAPLLAIFGLALGTQATLCGRKQLFAAPLILAPKAGQPRVKNYQ
jgi:hypothetical protein